jgi:hypothetical protein
MDEGCVISLLEATYAKPFFSALPKLVAKTPKSIDICPTKKFNTWQSLK